jgi:hypothetical protein
MNNENTDLDQSVNGQEGGNESENDSDSSAGDSKDYARLYENQKIRAERAEARLKELRRSATKDTDAKAPTKEPKTEELDLGTKAYLRSAGITDAEEVELALTVSRKWDMSVDRLVDDEDFQAKLEKHRTQKANLAATSNVKGGGNASDAKSTAEYWIAKGLPPTRDQVPDRKTRAKIARALVGAEKSTAKFYND